jgi:hypothetical protein
MDGVCIMNGRAKGDEYRILVENKKERVTRKI